MILILILFTLLDHPRWQIRESATRALTPATNITLPWLEHVEKHGSIEASWRARRLVNQWYGDNARSFSFRLGKLPWIDGRTVPSYCDWLELAGRAQLQSSPDNPDSREGTRLLVESRIGNRQPYAETLRALWAYEILWRWEHSYWE